MIAGRRQAHHRDPLPLDVLTGLMWWGGVMPVVRRDGAEIHYEVHGSGFPVFTLALGGMRSTGSFWEKAAWNPVEQLSGHYQVITMDQRNAGSSRAPVTGQEGWETYTADQLAVLDELGVQRCHLIGMCIGGPFALALLRAAPERFARAVLLQPIGLDDNRDAFLAMFDEWRDELAPSHPETDAPAWDSYRSNMYGGEDRLFSLPESVLPTIGTPMLVLRGNDQFHPSSASELVASAVPGAQLVQLWKQPEYLPVTHTTITDFLAQS